jgi:hypothetical protein
MIFIVIGSILLCILTGVAIGWFWGFWNGKNQASKLLDTERAQLETGFDMERICKEVNDSPEFQAVCKRINDKMRAEVAEYFENENKKGK